MKRSYVIAIVLLAVVVFAAFALVLIWPYRGLLPLIQEPSQDIAELIDEAEKAEQEQDSETPLPEGVNRTDLPLSMPEGFSINIFARDLDAPRVLQFDSNNTLFASIPSRGQIVALPDEDRDGESDVTIPLLHHPNRPHGFLFFTQDSQEYLALAEVNALSMYGYDPETISASNGRKLADLPASGGHWTRTLFQPQGESRLLISIGSSCNVCNEADDRRATVQSFDPFNFDGLEPYATGLRNAVFLAERNPGEVWVTEMGRDHLGDDLPPDEINILTEGENYGWPICYGDNIHDTNFDKNTYIRNPCEDTIPSHIDLQAHSAPLGLAFVPEDAGWPEEYEGNLLVAYHGSWNRSVPTGYKIMRFVLDESGNEIRREEFISGWLQDNGDVLGRPVDLKFDTDGALYISDDRAGVIYRVTYE